MTQSPRMCEDCHVFIAFVIKAGVNSSTLCFPCYKHMLGDDEEATNWLDFRRISGEEQDVERWYEWYKSNIQKGSKDGKETRL